MKIYVTFIALLFLVACNTIDVKNSREKLLKYSNEGYTVKLNDSLVKINQIILDENNIEKILVEKSTKEVIILRKKRDLNLYPLNLVVNNTEKNKLLVIDGTPIKPQELDSMSIEFSAFRSVTVLKNEPKFCERTYEEVILVTTHSNDR